MRGWSIKYMAFKWQAKKKTREPLKMSNKICLIMKWLRNTETRNGKCLTTEYLDCKLLSSGEEW